MRVLCAMAIHPEARDAVARSGHLADPLARLLAHHRGLNRWSSMRQPSLPLPGPEKPATFLALQIQKLPPASDSMPSTKAPPDARYDADGEGDSDDVRGSSSSGDEAGEAQPPIVDVSDEVLERIRNILEVRAEAPPSFVRGMRMDTAEVLVYPCCMSWRHLPLLQSSSVRMHEHGRI